MTTLFDNDGAEDPIATAAEGGPVSPSDQKNDYPELDLGVILDGISEGFFALDAEWRFIAFNPAAEEIFRLQRADVLGRVIWELSPGIIGTEFERRYRLAMSERLPQTFEMRTVLRPDNLHRIRAFPLGSGIGIALQDVTYRVKTDQALREREAELARVQRIGGVGGLDVDFRNDFASRRSPEYLHLHGLPDTHASEHHSDWLKRVHPQDRADAERHLFEVIASDTTSYVAEYRIIRPNDGEIRWIRAIAEIERDASGRAIKLVGAHLDITGRKLAERALAESEERFRSIANSAPALIWVSDANDQTAFANHAYLDFIGQSYAAALRFDWRTIVHFEDLARVLDEKRHGEAALQPFAIEARYLRNDDQWRWLRSEFQPRRNSSGEPDGFICVAQDVTGSKEAEHKLTQINVLLERRIEQRSSQLAATEALIRTFFQHSSECHAVLVEMSDGRFVYEEINPATLHLYGKTRAQVIGRTTEEVLDRVPAGDVNFHMNAALQSGLPQRYERAQGERVLEATATPVPTAHGSPRRVVVSARDVTERRRLEDQLRQAQKMEAVGQLTGGIAHDFNNLMTIVMGGLEAVGRHVAADPAGRVTQIIRAKDMALQGVQRAATLTSRLLAFSRQQALNPQAVDANRLVTGLTDILKRAVGEAVTLDASLADDLWTTFADPNQLENAILNLAVNARDAMPDGGTLSLQTRNVSPDGGPWAGFTEAIPAGQYVMLAVSDTGVGMDAETRERAFDPFFTTKDVGKGTGLGLSQVYGFARQSAGHVKIYSEIGEGTTVKIYLPRHYGVDRKVEAPVSQDIVGAHGHEVVLVVEDDEALRIYTSDILRELGYQVIEAANGIAAIGILQGGTVIDLLLSDIVMAGGVNGSQLADQAMALRPGLKVLFMTGFSRKVNLPQSASEAATHVVAKPFSFEELAARVRARLDLDS